MTLNHPLQQTWDLESIFPGKSGSAELKTFLASMAQQLEEFHSSLQQQEQPEAGFMITKVQELQELQNQLREAESFTSCLSAENMNDGQAVKLGAKVKEMIAGYETALSLFDQLLLKMEDDAFQSLLEEETMKPVSFAVKERRIQAKDKMDAKREALLQDLALDGYHGWAEHYNTIVGRLSFELEQDGKLLKLSAGQAANKLNSAERKVRVRMFEEWEKVWKEHGDLFSDTLNRLAGFRLQIYKHRGWESVLKEPLEMNRMQQATLDTIWNVIEQNKPRFITYLRKKASLMGLQRLSWVDVEAPVGKAKRSFSYDDGADFIVEQFEKFSPKMAEFAQLAFHESWIEAEDRSGKRPGGFCTSFPIRKQSRIFMTYEGSASNVSTLAHELGHAYHQYVMDDMPPLTQNYAMNVAETASTFAEMIVSDAAVKAAADDEERLYLLDDKLQRAIAFYMNIHARFLFETRFYEQRKEGVLSAEELSELMLGAQKEAYLDELAAYHPNFWASKLHFYLTDVPFYNFPYTFGYMFSAGIYALAEQEGHTFEDKYVSLLRDTGRMTVEELAQKHLQVDLTKPEFWQRAIDVTYRDVELFIKLAEQQA
ncbi:M3 family oligoendopeptidase [Marinicrinis lubricantis]|uniref:M3 family oligoendopeptidase n=1 Tax=Marinicrinis lubricantis TaxID=2086470 RepID=A0ABW1IPK7_9BACL